MSICQSFNQSISPLIGQSINQSISVRQQVKYKTETDKKYMHLSIKQSWTIHSINQSLNVQIFINSNKAMQLYSNFTELFGHISRLAYLKVAAGAVSLCNRLLRKRNSDQSINRQQFAKKNKTKEELKSNANRWYLLKQIVLNDPVKVKVLQIGWHCFSF